LLFLGDGHAANGAGELTGDALETTLEVEFTVDLICGKSLSSAALASSNPIARHRAFHENTAFSRK
jgi:amidase